MMKEFSNFPQCFSNFLHFNPPLARQVHQTFKSLQHSVEEMKREIQFDRNSLQSSTEKSLFEDGNFQPEFNHYNINKSRRKGRNEEIAS